MQTVLLVSARAEDRRGLQSVLSGTEWALTQVADSAAAVDSLKRTGFPIVLCDRDLAGGEWQDTLRLLLSVRDKPCVILLSNVADEYLWNEVCGAAASTC